jgi:hypothetical protein
VRRAAWASALAGLAAAGAAAAEPPDVRPSLLVAVKTDFAWIGTPSAGELSAAMPDAARKLGVHGRALLECKVAGAGLLAAGGRLQECAVIEESPSEFGFGAAALSLAPRFRPSSDVQGFAIRFAVAWPRQGPAEVEHCLGKALYREATVTGLKGEALKALVRRWAAVLGPQNPLVFASAREAEARLTRHLEELARNEQARAAAGLEPGDAARKGCDTHPVTIANGLERATPPAEVEWKAVAKDGRS